MTRVAADPAPFEKASRPGGWLGENGDGRGATVSHRWHGSPRMYWSSYDEAWLASPFDEIRRRPARGERWSVFDNMASGSVLANAVRFGALITERGVAVGQVPNSDLNPATLRVRTRGGPPAAG